MCKKESNLLRESLPIIHQKLSACFAIHKGLCQLICEQKIFMVENTSLKANLHLIEPFRAVTSLYKFGHSTFILDVDWKLKSW